VITYISEKPAAFIFEVKMIEAKSFEQSITTNETAQRHKPENHNLNPENFSLTLSGE
jgi:hypothetical protein